MPTQLLVFGQPITLATNQVYALPAAKAVVYCDTAATLEQSNVIDFSVKTAVTLVNGMATLGGVWLRATSGTPIISLKRDS